jgi:RimJ/RimL family protein N-acetyltransferase
MSEPIEFRFKPLDEEDLEFLLEVRNGCSHFLHDDRQFTLPDCLAWFQAVRPTYFVVTVSDARIGYFRLSKHDPARHAAYVGADLHPDFRGRGLAAPAYEAFFDFLRREFGLKTVELEVLSHNIVAMGLYRKLGFVQIGRLSGAAVRAGELVDSLIMKRSISDE